MTIFIEKPRREDEPLSAEQIAWHIVRLVWFGGLTLIGLYLFNFFAGVML